MAVENLTGPSEESAEPEPPAFFLREVVLDTERDHGPDEGKGVGHYGNDGTVAQTYDRGNMHAGEQRGCFLGGQHRG